MHYTILYDAGRQGFQNWSQLALALLLVILPSFILWYRSSAGWRFPRIVVFTLAILIFMGVSMGLIVPFEYHLYSAVQTAVKQHQFQTVQGIVTNLVQPRYDPTAGRGFRNIPGRFVVNGIPFSCWDKNNLRGHDFFQRTDLLQNGLLVRINYVNLYGRENIITHLEVGSHP